MITVYDVALPDGTVTVTTLAEARGLVVAHPGVEVEPRVLYTPCVEHRAYETANCPLCGTSSGVE
jgi:hypothetical protein